MRLPSVSRTAAVLAPLDSHSLELVGDGGFDDVPIFAFVRSFPKPSFVVSSFLMMNFDANLLCLGASIYLRMVVIFLMPLGSPVVCAFLAMVSFVGTVTGSYLRMVRFMSADGSLYLLLFLRRRRSMRVVVIIHLMIEDIEARFFLKPSRVVSSLLMMNFVASLMHLVSSVVRAFLVMLRFVGLVESTFLMTGRPKSEAESIDLRMMGIAVGFSLLLNFDESRFLKMDLVLGLKCLVVGIYLGMLVFFPLPHASSVGCPCLAMLSSVGLVASSYLKRHVGCRSSTKRRGRQ